MRIQLRNLLASCTFVFAVATNAVAERDHDGSWYDPGPSLKSGTRGVDQHDEDEYKEDKAPTFVVTSKPTDQTASKWKFECACDDLECSRKNAQELGQDNVKCGLSALKTAFPAGALVIDTISNGAEFVQAHNSIQELSSGIKQLATGFATYKGLFSSNTCRAAAGAVARDAASLSATITQMLGDKVADRSGRFYSNVARAGLGAWKLLESVTILSGKISGTSCGTIKRDDPLFKSLFTFQAREQSKLENWAKGVPGAKLGRAQKLGIATMLADCGIKILQGGIQLYGGVACLFTQLDEIDRERRNMTGKLREHFAAMRDRPLPKDDASAADAGTKTAGRCAVGPWSDAYMDTFFSSMPKKEQKGNNAFSFQKAGCMGSGLQGTESIASCCRQCCLNVYDNPRSPWDKTARPSCQERCNILKDGYDWAS